MKLLLIFLIILLILFTPIPLKLNIYISTNDYYIKLYKITLISKQKITLKKKKTKSTKNILSKLFKQNNFESNNFDFNNLKSLLRKLYNLTFKPSLFIKFSFNYSLNDAARTAVFLGIIYQISDVFKVLLNIPFKTKKYIFNVTPVFKDEFLLKFEISSIIFLSFVHIIYMLIIILRDFQANKKSAY